MGQIGVYILRCANGRYYTGSTIDFTNRLREHQQGEVRSTKNIRPIECVSFLVCETEQQARKLERKLKKLKSRKILEQIVQEGKIRLSL